MNYRKHYDLLIDRARDRKITGYVERHHIVPRCLGGSDDASNLVKLTAEEHYVAHQLLVMMHPGETKLVWAAAQMATRPGNKHYGWLRRKMSAARTGTKQTPEHIAKLAAVRRGRVLSDEHKAKNSAALRGRTKSPETLTRMKAAAKLRGISDVTRKAAAIANSRPRGPISESTRAAIVAARAANPYKHPPEVLEKMRASRKGRKLTQQHRQNLAAARLGKKRGSYKKRAEIVAQ